MKLSIPMPLQAASLLMSRFKQKWCSFFIQRYKVLRHAPACMFPVRNEATGNVVWFEMTPSGYGIYLTVHRQKPPIKTIRESSPDTAMAMVHVDYYINFPQEREQIKVQLWDEKVSPSGDPGWDIPKEYNSHRDASILLVKDVETWFAGERAEAGQC